MRKSFNKIVKSLSQIYGMKYNEVSKVYYQMNQDTTKTRMYLNLKQGKQ